MKPTMQPVSQASSVEVALSPAPIPADWVLRGNPEARAAELWRSLDGTMVTSAWDCTGGAFEWHFGCEETVHIVEGDVRVIEASGQERVLKAGDVAVFHAGTVATWEVESYVRKIAMCRHPVPASVGYAVRALRKVATLMRRAQAEGPAALRAASRA
jgi:uncharacterized cupin superfamily protein